MKKDKNIIFKEGKTENQAGSFWNLYKTEFKLLRGSAQLAINRWEGGTRCMTQRTSNKKCRQRAANRICHVERDKQRKYNWIAGQDPNRQIVFASWAVALQNKQPGVTTLHLSHAVKVKRRTDQRQAMREAQSTKKPMGRVSITERAT